jgi:hypothetical protein
MIESTRRMSTEDETRERPITLSLFRLDGSSDEDRGSSEDEVRNAHGGTKARRTAAQVPAISCFWAQRVILCPLQAFTSF